MGSLIRSLTVTPAFTLGENYPGHTVFLSENFISKAETKVCDKCVNNVISVNFRKMKKKAKVCFK